MPEKPFYSLGMTNACTHLGSREKPSFSPWFCCHFQSVIYFILHAPSLGWDHLLETGNLKQVCLQAGLSSPFRSTPFILTTKNGPFILQMHRHAWDSHNSWSSHPREALQSQFPLSGLPLKDSQVNHKGRGAAFSVPPLFSGNSKSYTWKEEEWCRGHGPITPSSWAIRWGDISIA